MRQVKPLALLKGLASFAPGMRPYFCSASGGTRSASYCYAVWMRHMVKASAAGLSTRFERIAELGPGDSVGIGLSGILSGANEYYALDAKPHADLDRNKEVLADLIRFFRQRSAIPDEAQFPDLSPVLGDYSFPRQILPDADLDQSLHPDRIGEIEQALAGGPSANAIRIRYIAPWQGFRSLELEGRLDMAFSQAVMEHVEDVPGTYTELSKWLRPGAFMSHTIDYKSHGYTRSWNGHWTVSERQWKIVKGRRPYLINRMPHSVHVSAIERAGFKIVAEIKRPGPIMDRRLLADAFAKMSDDDLTTSGAFILAMKI